MTENIFDAATAATGGARVVEIGRDQAGQRIDNFLLTQLKGVPKSHIYRLLRSGQVRVNKGRKKPGYKVMAGDQVRIPPVRLSEKQAVRIPAGVIDQLGQAILLENEDLLVVNKPAGLAVHGGSELDFGLIEAMRARMPGQYLELVHRLDRGTSGVLVLAKNRAALSLLHKAMRDHTSVHKSYLALLAGQWSTGKTTVTHPLKKFHRGAEHRVEIIPDGQAAISHFELVHLYPSASLMKIVIETGRTHQIRVHAAACGHPVGGDEKYGDTEFNNKLKKLGLKRMFLHANYIDLPVGEGLAINAPLPEELTRLLDKLEK